MIRFLRPAPLALCLSLFFSGRALAADAPPEVDLTDLPPGRPVQVEVHTELAQISQIEDRDEKFNVEFYVYLSWRDPRLAFDAAREGRDKRVLPIDKVWTPEPQVMDGLGIEVQSNDSVNVAPDGTVFYRLYYHGAIGSDFDLHEFPFDRHLLSVAVEVCSGEAHEAVFKAGKHSLSEGVRVLPHGWNLAGTSTDVVLEDYPHLGEKYSRYVLQIDVRRDPHYYWWAIVLPLLPIVVTSWSVFWMDPKEFNSQVGVGVTAMLTVVAYRITIDSSLPLLSYMTRMDYFLLVCQVIVFTAFLMSVVIHVCHSLETSEMIAMARRINVACRWASPLAMTVACGLLWALRPETAMLILAGMLAVLLLYVRPTWGRLKLWTRAAVFPEQLVDDKPVQIHECLLKGPTRPSSRVG